MLAAHVRKPQPIVLCLNSANRGLTLRNSCMHRVSSAQRGIETMISDHGLGRARPRGRGRSEFANQWPTRPFLLVPGSLDKTTRGANLPNLPLSFLEKQAFLSTLRTDIAVANLVPLLNLLSVVFLVREDPLGSVVGGKVKLDQKCFTCFRSEHRGVMAEPTWHLVRVY